ncbi:MAG: 3-hydroxyacyl-CoA dehydrogenase [Candidatus Abyssobacteria bacterium SURF_17]|uniref:3-hydroxyacyl-CoA dehydrogenase n=1 Tax=Candidatus Abyssobacteria bacterium SURF_17 TaxID=2093361 RepID=A0A419F998_9BACT|nr:MAG: 3-hydroxyacyl-CoA dehydrogenase [Candidatus Abyssubacteria bacterium SURF_17]
MDISEVKRIAVIGAGTMGSRISLACALHGYDVIVHDISDDALRGLEFRLQFFGYNWVQAGLTEQEAVEKSLSRIRTASDPADAAADADILIEAVSEKLDVKHKVFRQFDKLCPQRTIFVSNTSSLLTSEMETSLKRKDRFAALHFHRYKTVVDIMRGTKTSDDSVELLKQFSRSMDELPIVMKKEHPGFLHNWMFISWLEAGIWLAAGGYGAIEDIDRSWMKVHNMPYGPFGALDFVGLDVASDIGTGLEGKGHPGHWREIREFLKPYIEKGYLGVKTGRGFYTYPEPAYAQPGFLEEE